MPSAAEQLAANFNFGSLAKATELRQRIFFTVVVLIIARLGTYIPMPGIDPSELALGQGWNSAMRVSRDVSAEMTAAAAREGSPSPPSNSALAHLA